MQLELSHCSGLRPFVFSVVKVRQTIKDIVRLIFWSVPHAPITPIFFPTPKVSQFLTPAPWSEARKSWKRSLRGNTQKARCQAIKAKFHRAVAMAWCFASHSIYQMRIHKIVLKSKLSLLIKVYSVTSQNHARSPLPPPARTCSLPWGGLIGRWQSLYGRFRNERCTSLFLEKEGKKRLRMRRQARLSKEFFKTPKPTVAGWRAIN